MFEPQLDPSDHQRNVELIEERIRCAREKPMSGFILTNRAGSEIAIRFSNPEEYAVSLFCSWFIRQGYTYLASNQKLVLMIFLAEQFNDPSDELRDILEFIFDSRGDILITPIRIKT